MLLNRALFVLKTHFRVLKLHFRQNRSPVGQPLRWLWLIRDREAAAVP